MNKRKSLILRYQFISGIIIGVLTVLWLLLEYVSGLHDKHHEIFFIVTHFVFLIPAVGIYLSLSKIRKRYYGGSLTLKQGFLAGLFISIVYSAVAGLGQYLYHIYVNPEYFDAMITQSETMGVKREDAQGFFNSTSYVTSVIISYFFVGVILSLVMGLILKKGSKS